jgi:hypothetical protein
MAERLDALRIPLSAGDRIPVPPFGWLPEAAALAFFALKLAAVGIGATIARHAGLSEGRWRCASRS